MSKKIILYIATSLDGFIAKKDGSVAFLDSYNNTEEDYGYNKFYASIDTIIMGNTTYKQFGHTKEFEDFYKGKPIFVFSRNPKDKIKNITFTNEEVKEFCKKLTGNVWMLGGASIFNEFLRNNLIDEFIITIIPILLGNGIPLFKKQDKDIKTKLKLLNVKSYNAGVVQVHYKK